MILDTNALSALCEGEGVLQPDLPQHAVLTIPVIVLGEFEFGIRRSRLRGRYEQWLKTNLPIFDVLGVGRETARLYADIRSELKAIGKPIPSNDIWIAALAREYGLPIVTRDGHFRFVRGIQTVKW